MPSDDNMWAVQRLYDAFNAQDAGALLACSLQDSAASSLTACLTPSVAHMTVPRRCCTTAGPGRLLCWTYRLSLTSTCL